MSTEPNPERGPAAADLAAGGMLRAVMNNIEALAASANPIDRAAGIAGIGMQAVVNNWPALMAAFAGGPPPVAPA